MNKIQEAKRSIGTIYTSNGIKFDGDQDQKYRICCDKKECVSKMQELGFDQHKPLVGLNDSYPECAVCGSLIQVKYIKDTKKIFNDIYYGSFKNMSFRDKYSVLLVLMFGNENQQNKIAKKFLNSHERKNKSSRDERN